MLHTLLLILKIMGIILAVLIGVLLLVLIIPCTYKVKGRFNNDDSRLNAKIISFLGIIYFRLFYTVDTLEYVVRLFGIPFLKGDLFEECEEEEEENPYDTDEVFEELVQDFEGNITVQELTEEVKKKPRRRKKKNQDSGYNIPDDYIAVDDGHDETLNKKSGITNYVRRFFDKIKNIISSIKGLRGKIKRIIKLIRSKSFKIAVQYTKNILYKILGHIKPKKLRANVTFGCEKPDSTGKVLGVLGMMIGALKIDLKNFNVVPDFQKKRIEGDIYMKGRFVLIYLLVLALKFYFKKEIQYIINNFKGKQV